ncbi:uncharacterized protein LOC124159389 [Ischnura elegans]|uniref:uncharacterized protein LOC124159389 n=1 Tax=Ischnura elegans TaxID=197161 RepID=UPI001ED86CDC|nr:uncharacterized protein LOC124159389 [Ischnura elegans]
MRHYCSVSGCGTHISDGRLFPFPKAEKRAMVWKAFCDNSELEGECINQLFYKGAICRKHFRVEDFQTHECLKLNRNAVPVLHPPISCTDSVSSSDSSPPSPIVASFSSTALPISSSLSCHQPSPFHPSPSLLERSSSAVVVTSTPGSSPPQLLPKNLTPVSASPSTFGDEARGNAFGSHCQNPVLEEERPSLATSSMVITSSLSGDISGSSDSCSRTMKCPSVRRGALLSILHDIGMKKVSGLTPRKKLMFSRMKNLRRQLKKLTKVTDGSTSACNSNHLLQDSRFLNGLDHNFPPSVVKLVKMLLREGNRKPKGRRWSHEEKVLALSIFKKSPKCYSLLRALIPLPCRKTLSHHLSKFTFLPGINPGIFKFLSSVVEGMEERDRYCCILFDEMALRPGLQYDSQRDQIVGFEDHGTMGTSNALAKVAMVFMARGLFSAWKQPLAYYFSASATSSEALREMLGEVLRNLTVIGLNVVATVCDMGTNNVQALRLMGASFEDPSFDFEGKTVVTIFDPPHLLKRFHNLFMKHDVSVPVVLAGNEVNLSASWHHLQQLYDEDGRNPFGRLFPLTEKHMNPRGFLKIRVFLASQVFSLRVGRGIGALVARGALGNSGLATAEFLIAINDLFDALNGDTEAKQRERKRGPITKNSGHIALLKKMEVLLGKIRFLRGRGPQFPPSHKGWLATIRGVCRLWERFQGRFPHLSTRNLNQGPLENLFGVLRQNCGSKHHLDAVHFVSALKTAIINGMVATRSRGNCEVDDCNILRNLNKFMNSNPGLECELLQPDTVEVGASVRKPIPVKGHRLSYKNIDSAAFPAGYVAAGVLQGNACSICQDSLISIDPSSSDLYYAVDGKDGEGSPTEGLTMLVDSAIRFLLQKLQKVGHCRQVSVKLRKELSCCDLDETFIRCQSHRMELASKMYPYIIQLALKMYCRERNRSLTISPSEG